MKKKNLNVQHYLYMLGNQ